jgi:hypothetical protein
MTSALMPVRPVTPRSILQLAAANIACGLHQSGVDRRLGIATYEVVLANAAAVAISGRLYALDARKQQQTFGAIEVAAQSVGRSLFNVPLDRRRDEGRVYMEIAGDGVYLLAEARPPVAARRPHLLAGAPLLALCACVALAAGAGVAVFGSAAGFASGSTIALAAPNRAVPGIVNVSYAVGGRAHARYRATLSDGTLLSAGALPSPSGDVAVVVPAAAVGRNVQFIVDASGPFGHTARSAAFAVDAPPAVVNGSPARILALTAHRETYGGNQSILASYSAVGTGGALRVLDARGTVVGSAPFTHVGTSRIPLSGNVSAESLRAELQVTRSGSHASAAVEIPAERDPRADDAALLGLHGGSSASDLAAMQDAGSTALPSDPFYVPDRVIGARSFVVAIRRALPNMHIELQDNMGTVLDGRAVPPGATEVTLDAPETTIVQTYYLAGTFVRASAEETLVRSLQVFPR